MDNNEQTQQLPVIVVPKFDVMMIESGEPEAVIKNDTVFILKNSVFACQFSKDSVDYMKENENINSFHIVPLMPKEIDPNSEFFEENLTEVVKFTIFHDQRCVDNLVVVTPDPEYVQITKNVIEKESRIISATNERFPKERNTLFPVDVTKLNGCVNIDENEHWWIKIAKEVETVSTFIKYEADDIEKENPISYTGGDPTVDDKYIVNIHKWLFNIEKFFGKPAGDLFSSVEIGTSLITVYYYEKGALLPKEQPEGA